MCRRKRYITLQYASAVAVLHCSARIGRAQCTRARSFPVGAYDVHRVRNNVSSSYASRYCRHCALGVEHRSFCRLQCYHDQEISQFHEELKKSDNDWHYWVTVYGNIQYDFVEIQKSAIALKVCSRMNRVWIPDKVILT